MFGRSSLPAIFLHIPKTAGLTVHYLLRSQYTRNETYSCFALAHQEEIHHLSVGEKRKLRLIAGHLDINVAEMVPQKLHFFTFLREPIARTISHYEYVKQFKDHIHHNVIIQKGSTLEAALKGGYLTNLDNCQVRFLSGAHHVPYGAIDETHYQVALHNLEHLMLGYGITEHFDESILLLQDAFNWKTPFNVKENVNLSTTVPQNLPMDLLERYNRYDLMLYAYARSQFLAKVSAGGAQFQKRVNTFRKMNKCFMYLAKLKRKLIN